MSMRLVSSVIVLALCACTPAAPPAEPTAPAAPEAPAAAEPAAPVAPPITGGYGAASLEDESVKAAQTVAVDEIYKREPTRALTEKVEVQQQVVAGMNYRFDITMTGGAHYNVTVFRSLDGKMEVTDFAKLN